MNDDQLEHHLRNLAAPELPASWRGEILATALREARAAEARSRNWPALLLSFRMLFARNPFTAGALTTLWILIFVFHATTPVDRAAQEMLAHVDSSRPIYFVDVAAEIRLAEILQEEPDQRPAMRIP